MERVGVIHGRFQPLHLGHLEYLLAARALCETLFVGITSPDPWHLGDEISDPIRGLAESNPCTYYERYLMVEASLVDAGLPRERLRIVPFPHIYPERLRYYAPADAVYFLSIYDDWGEVKLRRFTDLGLRTHVLWRRDRRFTSGGEIRGLMRAGDDRWRDLVPVGTAAVVDEHGIATRIAAPVGEPA